MLTLTNAMLKEARLRAEDQGFAVLDLHDFISPNDCDISLSKIMVGVAGLLLEYPFVYCPSRGEARSSLSQNPLARFTFSVTIEDRQAVVRRSVIDC